MKIWGETNIGVKHLNSKRWSNVGDNDGGDVVGDVGDDGGDGEDAVDGDNDGGEDDEYGCEIQIEEGTPYPCCT